MSFDDRPLIAVFDDEPEVRAVCCQALARAGYRTVEAGDVMAARRVVETHGLDGILTDTLDRGTNADAVRILRQRLSSRHVPLVFMTGAPSEVLLDEAVLVGADHVLVKPFDLRTLIDAFDRLVPLGTD